VTKLSAALTSSSRFSMRSAPSFRCGSARSGRWLQHLLDDLAQVSPGSARAARRSGHEGARLAPALPARR
jgi:hypothetical protein